MSDLSQRYLARERRDFRNRYLALLAGYTFGYAWAILTHRR